MSGTIEKKALRFSAFGMAIMAASGLGFALVSHSQAIMLDGVFSSIGFAMAMVTLKVAELVKRPDDDHFHFGYAHFAPLINVLKSLLMVVMCVFAMAAALDSISSGGRQPNLGWAVIYGAVATAACIASATYLRVASRKTGSTLVKVDSVSWVVDSMISGAVLLGFLLGYAVQGTSLEQYQRFLDPIIVIALVLLAIPEPTRILWTSLRESLLFAPPNGFQRLVRSKLDTAFVECGIETHRVRLLKLGDTVNVLIHARLGPDFPLKSVADLDQLRARIKESLDDLPERVILDVIFVDDMALAD